MSMIGEKLESHCIKKKHQIIRKRKPKSCIRCYTGKRKCDHKKPTCTRCAKKGVPCEYFTDEDVLERYLERRNDTLRADTGVSSHYSDSNSIHDDTIPNTELNPIPRESEAKNFKLIVNSTGEYSKYLSLSLFPFSDQSLNVSYIVDRTLKDQDKFIIFDFSYVPNRVKNKAEIKKLIPVKKHCDELVSYFFTHISPLIPVLDEEEFELKYNELWKNYNNYDDLNTLMVLFSVLFSSCVSIQITKVFLEGSHTSEDDPIDYERLKYVSFQCIENIKHFANTSMSPSMSAITALTIIYYVGSLNCHGTFGEVSALIRYCQIAGLHRSLSKFSDTSSTRAFLYSHVLYLDSLVAYYTGLSSYTNRDLFETVRNFPKKDGSLKTLHTLTRMHNSLVWMDLLNQLNRIEVSTENDYRRLNNGYRDSITIVNSLNTEIITGFPEVSDDYLLLLVAEGRLGLRKSAILVHFLKNSTIDPTTKSAAETEADNKDLVIQALLLINESLMKIFLSCKHNANLLWFSRNSYPFQAMSIVLTHLLKHTTKKLNFRYLPPEINFTKHPDIDYNAPDIRMDLIQKVTLALQQIKPLWPRVFQRRFERICDLKNSVFAEKLQENPTVFESDVNYNANKFESVNLSEVSNVSADGLLYSLLENDAEFQSLFFQNLPEHL